MTSFKFLYKALVQVQLNFLSYYFSPHLLQLKETIDTGGTGDFWLSCGITSASSVIILIIILLFLKRKIQVK